LADEVIKNNSIFIYNCEFLINNLGKQQSIRLFQ